MARLQLDADELAELAAAIPPGTALHRKLAAALETEHRRTRGDRRLLADGEWLRRRLDDGATVAEIADEAGCNPTSVYRALARHGIATGGRERKLTPETRRRLRRLLAQQLPVAEIAERLGVARMTIYRWEKEL